MILTLHQTGVCYEDAVEFVHRQWDESKGHDWCHTNSNWETRCLIRCDSGYSRDSA